MKTKKVIKQIEKARKLLKKARSLIFKLENSKLPVSDDCADYVYHFSNDVVVALEQGSGAIRAIKNERKANKAPIKKAAQASEKKVEKSS